LADFLVTVSNPAVGELEKLHSGKKVCLITNGFNPEIVNNPPIELISKFIITYTGQIYANKQNPTKILIALKDLINEGVVNPKKIELRFFGPKLNWLEKEIKNFGLSSVIKQCGPIPRKDAIQKQRESQALLLFNWEDVNVKGVYTGKIFEYLAARRPILSSGGFGGDVVEELLVITGAGQYCPQKEDVKNYLKNLYLEYDKTGKVVFRGNIDEINKYNTKEMTKNFVRILNDISK
jgi:glycosyltransferase involved in cell wall biosynthesis